MIRVFLVGASGRMGREIVRLSESENDLEIVAGLDTSSESNLDFPVYSNFDSIDTEFDVLVDFSSPELQTSLTDYLASVRKPAVLCTTGLSEQQEETIVMLAKSMPIFRSANMSVGIHVLTKLITQANRLLGDTFDCEIIEAHHRNKKDAPSGTALQLAKAIVDSDEEERPLLTDRSRLKVARQKGEITLQSIRGGSIAGDHTVIFAGESEVITIAHHAQSRSVFASGALRAAKFVANCEPGYYSMESMLG